MGRIRVMHIVLTLGNAGLENVVLNLCRQIDDPQIVQQVCYLQKSGSLEPLLKELGVEVFGFNKKPGLDFLLPLKLAWLFHRQKTDIVHSHDPGANFYGGLGGLIARVKTLVKTEHGGINLATSSLLRFDLWLSNRIQKTIAVSQYLKNIMVRQGARAEKIIVIPNGIKMEKYHGAQNRAQIRKELGFSPNDRIISTVGRFVPLKNTKLLIKVAPRIIAEFPDVRFAIIGFGPLEQELRQQVADLGLEDQVKFLISRMDIPRILPVMDYFVLCSRLEGLGIVIIEAMAAGKPVIASNVGGIPELVADQENGLLFSSDNEDELFAALKRVLASPELAEQLGQAGLESVRETFSISKMASSYAKVYRYHYYRNKKSGDVLVKLAHHLRRLVKRLGLEFIYYSGLHRLFRDKSAGNLRVITYHRIVETEALPYFPVGLAVTRETFEQHLIMYRRHFNLIDAATLMEHKEDLSALPPDSLLLTFDDGYQDNYRIAFKLMKKYDVPGIIFATCDFIGKSHLFWSDVLAYIVYAATTEQHHPEQIAGDLPENLIYSFSSLVQSRPALFNMYYNQLMQAFKETQGCGKLVEMMRAGISLEVGKIQEKCRMLNWDELKQMSENNIICGSHTLSHPNLTSLEEEEIQHEVMESKRIIEEKTGCLVNYFSYPYGCYNQGVRDAVAKAQYQIAFALEDGDNNDLLALCRHNVWENSFRDSGGQISPKILKLELSWLIKRLGNLF